MKLYENFIVNVYTTAENIYNNVVIAESIDSHIWKWNNNPKNITTGALEEFGDQESSFSLFTMRKDVEKTFNESISFLDDFFVEKVPFIYEKKFNRFAYEKYMSIDLLNLVIYSKNSIFKNPLLTEQITDKVKRITNYQGFLSIILNMLASTVGDFGNRLNLDMPLSDIFGYRSLIYRRFDGDNPNKDIELMFSKFIINFYNIWKNEIRHINNDKDYESNIPYDKIEEFFRTHNIKYYYYNQKESSQNNKNPINFTETLEYDNIIEIKDAILDNKMNQLIPGKRNGETDNHFDKRLEKAKKEFHIKNLNFAIISKSSAGTITMDEYYQKINNILTRVLGNALRPGRGIDLSLIADKSTKPSILRFFYEAKIDLFDHNYKGITIMMI